MNTVNTREKFFPNVTDEQWNDWHWQIRNRIESLEDLKKGIEMTMKGCQDSFAKLGVQEIDTTGEFDPNLHNAVMHIEDENLGKNAIAEVFQKGYKKDDKIIRHTMVKVAN